MKKLFLSLFVLSLLTLVGCKQGTTSDATESEETTEMSEAAPTPDYEAFNNKVNVLKSFFKAHENEDLEMQRSLLADSLKWSPPYYNGNKLLGKEDLLATLQGYHENFDNIKYTEGVVLGDNVEAGWWSGSVYPADEATVVPDVIRIYGTWTATHAETGKEVGLKFYALGSVNADGKIYQYSSYFDAHGLNAQLEEGN